MSTSIIVTVAVVGALSGIGALALLDRFNKAEAPIVNEEVVQMPATDTSPAGTPNPGNFQLLPTYASEYPPYYDQNFMEACLATSGNNVDACSCSLEYLKNNYSIEYVISMEFYGIPDELIGAMRDHCYLPQAGYDAEYL